MLRQMKQFQKWRCVRWNFVSRFRGRSRNSGAGNGEKRSILGTCPFPPSSPSLSCSVCPKGRKIFLTRPKKEINEAEEKEDFKTSVRPTFTNLRDQVKKDHSWPKETSRWLGLILRWWNITFLPCSWGVWRRQRCSCHVLTKVEWQDEKKNRFTWSPTNTPSVTNLKQSRFCVTLRPRD